MTVDEYLEGASGEVFAEHARELEGYEWSNGTLEFPVDQPLPKTLLEGWSPRG